MTMFSKMLEAVLPNEHKIAHTEGNLDCALACDQPLVGIARMDGFGDFKPQWVIQRVAADPAKPGEWYIRKLYFDGSNSLSDCYWGYCAPMKSSIVRPSLSGLVGKIIAFWNAGISADAVSVATEAGVKWLQQRAATEFLGITTRIRKDVMKAYRSYESGCHSCMTGNDSQFTEVYESCDRVRLVEVNQDGKYFARFITVKLETWPTWDVLPEEDNPLNPAAIGWKVVRVYPFPRHDHTAEEQALKYIAQQMPWLTSFLSARPDGGVGGIVPDSEYLPYLDMSGNFWVGHGEEEGKIVLYWGDCSPPAGEGQRWSRLSGDNHTGGNLAHPPEPEYEHNCCSCDEGLNDDDVWQSPDGNSYCQGCYDERWTTDWRGRTIDLDGSLTIMGGCYSQCQCSRHSIPEDYTEAWDYVEQIDCIALTEDCREIGDVWYYGIEDGDIVQAKRLNWNPTTQLWDVGDEEESLKTPSGNGYITTIPSIDLGQYYVLPQKIRNIHGALRVITNDEGAATVMCGTWTLKRWHGIHTGAWHWVLSSGQDALPSHSIQWRLEALDIRNFTQFAPNTESEVSNA